jgi:hypothetical protein
MVTSTISETTLSNHPWEVPHLKKKELITALAEILAAKYWFVSLWEHNNDRSTYYLVAVDAFITLLQTILIDFFFQFLSLRLAGFSFRKITVISENRLFISDEVFYWRPRTTDNLYAYNA